MYCVNWKSIIIPTKLIVFFSFYYIYFFRKERNLRIIDLSSSPILYSFTSKQFRKTELLCNNKMYSGESFKWNSSVNKKGFWGTWKLVSTGTTRSLGLIRRRYYIRTKYSINLTWVDYFVIGRERFSNNIQWMHRKWLREDKSADSATSCAASMQYQHPKILALEAALRKYRDHSSAVVKSYAQFSLPFAVKSTL